MLFTIKVKEDTRIFLYQHRVHNYLYVFMFIELIVPELKTILKKHASIIFWFRSLVSVLLIFNSFLTVIFLLFKQLPYQSLAFALFIIPGAFLLRVSLVFNSKKLVILDRILQDLYCYCSIENFYLFVLFQKCLKVLSQTLWYFACCCWVMISIEGKDVGYESDNVVGIYRFNGHLVQGEVLSILFLK